MNCHTRLIKHDLLRKLPNSYARRKIEGITDLRDESDRNGMRVVIELRRDVNPSVVLNNLYKHTQMQIELWYNMLALVNGEPKSS